MKYIQLTNSTQLVSVDDSDYPLLSKSKWRLTSLGYASRTACVYGKSITILMHREIIGTPEGLKTDHINRNRLDNRRKNLRICTNGQNVMNSKPFRKSFTGIKGVRFHKQMQRYTAHIAVNHKEMYLGMFDSIEEAHAVYVRESLRLHGDFSTFKTYSQAGL